MKTIMWIIVFICATAFLSYLMTAGQAAGTFTFAHLAYAIGGGIGIAGWVVKQASS